MIEFLSFFLALTTGPNPVELAVAGPVAAVELRLDGRTVATLAGEPWSTLCDLGPELAPKELVAIARDRGGRELDRATQWINVGTQSSGATMSFETDAEGRPRAVGVRWESIGRRQPQAIEVAFDGDPLEVSDPKRVVLPPYDGESLHFVSATVRFSELLVTRLDAGFGGVYTESVASELTAVPILLENGGPTPRPEELRSAFVKGGEPLTVHGVEKPGAEIIVVRDPPSQTHFASMTKAVRRPHTAFGEDVRLFFLSPRPALMLPAVVTSEVFPRSPLYPAGDDGLLFLTQKQRPTTFPVHLAEAVAMAGMTAQAGHGRRAVVLVLGGEPEDASRYSAVQVREYLRRLRVPLYVWSTVSRGPHREWGEVRWVGKPARLAEAVAAVAGEVAAQRVVWLEGRHLPQAIELAGEGRGLRLAAAAPPTAAPPTAVPSSILEPLAEPLPDVDGEPAQVELFFRRDGLVTGPHLVELSVVGPVAEVEIRLDQRPVGKVSGEPWTLVADLGGDLAPHRLAALSRDREGRELERTERWLNLAPPAESLTAVAVVVDRGVTLPAPEAMAGWFTAGGRPVSVEKVDSGAAEVAVVRDPLAQPELDALANSVLASTVADQADAGRGLLEPGGDLWSWMSAEDLAPAQAQLLRKAVRRLRDVAGLGAGVSVRFLSPMAAPVSQIGSERNLFHFTGPYTPGDGDFLDLAHRISARAAFRLADAVAVAAMELHGNGRRRAVVVLLGDQRPDESLFTSARVQAYLRALQVPVFLWSATPAPPRPQGEWGAVRWVSSRRGRERLANLQIAAAELRRHLESQRIVHLAGRHLPQSIALTEEAAAAGLRLAGHEPLRPEEGTP